MAHLVTACPAAHARHVEEALERVGGSEKLGKSCPRVAMECVGEVTVTTSSSTHTTYKQKIYNLVLVTLYLLSTSILTKLNILLHGFKHQLLSYYNTVKIKVCQ